MVRRGGSRRPNQVSDLDGEFTGLKDTPKNYSGEAGNFLQVNPTEDGVIFSSVSAQGLEKFEEFSDESELPPPDNDGKIPLEAGINYRPIGSVTVTHPFKIVNGSRVDIKGFTFADTILTDLGGQPLFDTDGETVFTSGPLTIDTRSGQTTDTFIDYDNPNLNFARYVNTNFLGPIGSFSGQFTFINFITCIFNNPSIVLEGVGSFTVQSGQASNLSNYFVTNNGSATRLFASNTDILDNSTPRFLDNRNGNISSTLLSGLDTPASVSSEFVKGIDPSDTTVTVNNVLGVKNEDFSFSNLGTISANSTDVEETFSLPAGEKFVFERVDFNEQDDTSASDSDILLEITDVSNSSTIVSESLGTTADVSVVTQEGIDVEVSIVNNNSSGSLDYSYFVEGRRTSIN
jgi:hypothetical protein